MSDARGLHAQRSDARRLLRRDDRSTRVTLALTGNPASEEFVREQVARAVREAAPASSGAQIIVSSDDVPFRGVLDQDDVATFNVPVLIQGRNEIEVDGSTHVDVRNIAVPRISPGSLMVSDYPERLTENGTLFSADLRLRRSLRDFFTFTTIRPGSRIGE